MRRSHYRESTVNVTKNTNIFDMVSFLLKFIFLLKKTMDFLFLKRHNSF